MRFLRNLTGLIVIVIPVFGTTEPSFYSDLVDVRQTARQVQAEKAHRLEHEAQRKQQIRVMEDIKQQSDDNTPLHTNGKYRNF